ncbi:Pentatricopeptide repeat-containing protein [Senna tora]|uniref:Pentatricopeptide repeat-containing protein n=1 Tax=Senna tora TaxID=362788 RepID=A0A834T880_9FABA|nr:Pentatricopeptide repeat-containing protein [Senna tora]
MEKISSSSSSSPRGTAEGGGLLSCWGCLKLKLPWRKRGSTYRPVGGFKYDPLSYAQNFDEGWDHDDELSTRAFSTRYAAPSTNNKSPAHK